MNLEELLAKCEMIQELSDKIAVCKDEILKLKERKQCKNCYEEIEINANYCPNCGCEQEKVTEETFENPQEEGQEESKVEEQEKENTEEKTDNTDNSEEE